MRVAAITTAVLILISGCGGGGGNPLIQSSELGTSSLVPYSTPNKVATITPLVDNNTGAWALTQNYTADLTGNGSENFIAAGSMTPNTSSAWNNGKIHILGWHNGKLVDQTSQWFQPGENIVVGGNTLKFADFDKNGWLDMLVAGYTDVDNFFSSTYLYYNNGSRFTRVTIDPGTFNAHDAVVYDFFGTGYSDILFTDYGPNSTLAKNNQDGTFTNYIQTAFNRQIHSASSFAAADFLGNNTASIIATDQCNAGCTQFSNKLYSITIDIPTQSLAFTELNTLPTPRFALPKWAGYNFGDGLRPPSHDVRSLAWDWDGIGLTDAVIISRPNLTQNKWPEYSEVQFLKNHGAGNFTDETDSVLVGYNTNTSASYQPKLIDINGDGRLDLLLSGGDFDSTNNSHQILINTKDGKFVAAFQNVLSDFSTQATAMQPGANNTNGNIVNIIHGPGDKFYLITEVHYKENNTLKQSVYLSLLGSSTVTSDEAISTIKTQWPWMSDASVNTVLAKTGTVYLNGHILDLEKALSPIGGLYVKNLPISGHISGIQLENLKLPIQSLDSFGRNFQVNISPSVLNDSNWWTKNTVPDQITPRSQTEYLVGGYRYEFDHVRFGGVDGNWSIGTPLLPLNESTFVSAQMTTLSYNPWVQFNGMWGAVNYSSMFESVITHKKYNWQYQLGYILNTTSIQPGIITKVNDFHAVWAETGYATQQFGFFAGVRPYIVNGSLNAEFPTGIDMQGNLQYTNAQFKVNNPVNMYLRSVYTDTITKNLSYKVSGMYVDNGQYRTQLELKYSY
jgi:hypothetical protein